jgi:FkbM family methyltransferase
MIAGFVDLVRVSRKFGIGAALRISVNRLIGSPSLPFPVRGQTLHIPNEPYALRHIIESVPKIQKLVDAIPPGDIKVIFDVGSNAGIFSTLARARWPEARIFAFEASPDMCRFISRNISDENFKIVDRAVSDRDGQKLDFYIREDAQQTNSLIRDAVELVEGENEKHKTLTVLTASIDDFCAREGIDRVDVLKVDIQGGESAMLEGSKRMLGNIRHLLIETTFLDPNLLPMLQLLHGAYNTAEVVNLVVSGADMHFQNCGGTASPVR